MNSILNFNILYSGILLLMTHAFSWRAVLIEAIYGAYVLLLDYIYIYL